MKQKLMALFVSILCLLSAASVSAGELVIGKFKVEPDTSYDLSFKAKCGEPGARWFLRIYNRNGELPTSGCYEYEWQRITKGKEEYRHLFTPLNGAGELSFGIVYDGAKPEISDVSLVRAATPKMLVNGDFSAGIDNYSGWSETYNSRLVKNDSGCLLHINNNGYAISDPIPVAGGGKYSFTKDSVRPALLLILDKNLHLEDAVAPDYRTNVVTMPESAAYVRFFYKTWHDHLPAHRERDVNEAGFQKADETPRKLAELPPFNGEIILAADNDPREMCAAQELQYWIGRISGKEIPVLAVPSSKPNVKIFLGRKFAGKYKDDLSLLEGSDGYAVRRSGNSIHIFGAEPRGVLFGAYAFLERNSDIIWPRPHPEMAAVFSENPDLKFTEADFISRPVFKIRTMQFSGGNEKAARLLQGWMGRNGINTPFRLGTGFDYLRWRQGAMISCGGGMVSSFLGDKDEDISIYPMIDGKRQPGRWRQPCYTNPSVPVKIADRAREMLESVPGKKVECLSINLGDNWGVCVCPECMKPISLADGGTLTPKSTQSTVDSLFFSTRHFMMLNQVAAILSKDYPYLKIGTHAYIFTAEPPKVKIHPAIVPEFAAYPTSNTMLPILEQSAPQSQMWPRRFRQWMKDYDNSLGCFGYYNADGFNMLANTAAADYRALADNKPYQVHTEGLDFDFNDSLVNWDADGSEKWIIARLMWDPRQDPEKLREIYITRTYREAAPAMRKFYDLLRNSWETQKKRDCFVNCHTPGKTMFEKFIVETGIERPARELLKQAVNDAKNPVSKKIVERMLLMFDACAGGLNRNILPSVDESTAEWDDFNSPHWLKALRIADFKVLPDWRPVKEENPSAHPSEVKFMHDGKNLYVRITASSAKYADIPAPKANVFPKNDRVEMLFRVGSRTYYYAVGPGGETYSVSDWGADRRWKSSWTVKFLSLAEGWGAMLKIPMSELSLDSPEADADIKLGRAVFPDTVKFEYSTNNGRSIFNSNKLLRTPLIINFK